MHRLFLTTNMSASVVKLFCRNYLKELEVQYQQIFEKCLIRSENSNIIHLL